MLKKSKIGLRIMHVTLKNYHQQVRFLWNMVSSYLRQLGQGKGFFFFLYFFHFSE